jgi:EAL and modified HD-GYP domain-containing signal transduction protein
MTIDVALAESGRTLRSVTAAGGALRYVARQPILNLRGQVHGYELLFREGPDAFFSGDGDLATRTMLDNTVCFGLERLAAGALAFVNCTRESLTEELVNILPPSLTVLEILEDVEPTPDLVKACRKLKQAGFRFALDDFTLTPAMEPLVEMADYIKIDFKLSGPLDRQWILRRLEKSVAALVAEKVETQEEYQEACKEGFTYFQGYYFCRPILMENRKLPANYSSQMQILKMLGDEPLNLRRLSEAVKREASLTYRLLRLINSPACAVRQEVRSVQAALIAVGEENFRRIATLAITCELNAGQPAELLRMALVRGRFCELAAGLYALDATEQYLLGLLSLLSAMLRIPMAKLTPSLPLRKEICRALEGASVPAGRLLRWLASYENGNWAECDRMAREEGLRQRELAACYSQALLWAEDSMKFS